MVTPVDPLLMQSFLCFASNFHTDSRARMCVCVRARVRYCSAHAVHAQSCAAGQSTGGLPGAQMCSNCTAGTYRSAAMMNCTAVPSGSFSLEGATNFTRCAPGSYSAVPGSTQVRGLVVRLDMSAGIGDQRNGH